MRPILCGAIVLAFASLVVNLQRADAGNCCGHCGCSKPCCKVCRLVCEDKKVEVICWGCKCGDLCYPCPSSRCCKHCETVCINCDEDTQKKEVCSRPHKWVWWTWCPHGAQMWPTKKLMKRLEIHKVPSFKYEVVDLCKECEKKAKEEEKKAQAKKDEEIKAGRLKESEIPLPPMPPAEEPMAEPVPLPEATPSKPK